MALLPGEEQLHVICSQYRLFKARHEMLKHKYPFEYQS